MTQRNKVKHLGKDKCRVIKINKTALEELVYETVIDHLKEYFDLLDDTKVRSYHKFDPSTGEYMCLVYDNGTLPTDTELSILIDKISITTETMFAASRYRELTFDEIRGLLKEPLGKK